jgi:hypothetical protein
MIVSEEFLRRSFPWIADTSSCPFRHLTSNRCTRTLSLSVYEDKDKDKDKDKHVVRSTRTRTEHNLLHLPSQFSVSNSPG